MTIEKYSEGFSNPEKAPFSILANVVLQNVHDGLALGIWCYLQSLPTDWCVNKTQLKEHFGIGRDKLDQSLKLLQELNLLIFVQERDERGNFLPGYWRVLAGNNFSKEEQHVKRDRYTENPESGKTGIRKTRIHTNKNTNTNKNNIYIVENNSKKAQPTRDVRDKGETFWKAYPYKKQGKVTAMEKARKMGDKEFQLLMEGVERYTKFMKNEHERGFDRQYMLATRFINQKCYLDNWDIESDKQSKAPFMSAWGIS